MEGHTITGDQRMHEAVVNAMASMGDSRLWLSVIDESDHRIRTYRAMAKVQRGVATLDAISKATQCETRADELEDFTAVMRAAMEQCRAELAGKAAANGAVDSGADSGLAVGGRGDQDGGGVEKHGGSPKRQNDPLAGTSWISSGMPHLFETPE